MQSIANQQAIFDQLQQLPSLPLIVQEVIASFADPDLDSSVLTKKIALDQGLSAKVLRVANSPFYGLPRKVGSIQEATTVLGFDSVRALALSAGVSGVLSRSSRGALDRQAYWKRSFRIAALSKALAGKLKLNVQMAFTAGMFHDIGQLLLDLCVPEQFAALQLKNPVSVLELLTFEQNTWGYDHAEIGAELIRRWNFPSDIEQVIRHWARPGQQITFNRMVCVVHLAYLLECGMSGDDLISAFHAAGCNQWQLTWDEIEACLPSAEMLESIANQALI